MTPKPILKRFDDLTPGDFEKHPVWASVHTLDYDEPWHDNTDEETFRPWTGDLPVEPENGMFLVRAKLTLADGCVLDGFVTPQSESESMSLGAVQPQIFLPSGKRCDFWDGMFKRDPEDRKVLYTELGNNPAAVFPITFRAEKNLANGWLTGSIPGFCWCPEKEVRVYW